jgi:sugar-phosphatase
VSTAARANAEAVLRHLDLGPPLFDVRIFGEDVQRGKPDPECYLTAMTRLEAKPDECLVFEDSVVGIQAAEAAGTTVVRVRVP